MDAMVPSQFLDIVQNQFTVFQMVEGFNWTLTVQQFIYQETDIQHLLKMLLNRRWLSVQPYTATELADIYE